MKYYAIMLKKINLLILTTLAAGAWSQKGTQTPYSMFGLGELNQGEYAAFMSMGGISIANSDSTIANHNNPASYAYIQRYRPIFQVGLNGRYSVFNTSNTTSSQQHVSLNQFQLALPIKKKWGASLGLVPYSFTGYTITNYEVTDGDTTAQNINDGSGAISKLFLGVAYKPLNYSKLSTHYTKRDTSYTTKTHILSLGVNGTYLFGSVARTQSHELIGLPGAYNARVKTALRINAPQVQFGINYQYYFRPAYTDSLINGSFSIGASYTPGMQLRAYHDLFAHNYKGSGDFSYTYDTIEFVTDDKGYVYVPDQYKIGLEYRIGWKPSRKGERLLRLGAELNYQQWSAYRENFGTETSVPFYRDRLGLAFGLEFSPFVGNDPSISILSRTNYRFGFNYTQTELVLSDIGLNNYGMSFGFGIPLNVNSTNTSLNLGATFGKMGTTESGLIEEKYIGFYFGISIIPDRNELWFVKRKYD